MNMNNPAQKILIVTAVAAERDAVLRGLGNTDTFEVIFAGVGPAAAASGTARTLAGGSYKLVISAGIGGGFAGVAEIESLVIANRIIAADLGSETRDGFLSVDELGFGSSVISSPAEQVRQLTAALQAAGLPAVTGPILTVSTTTGTRESAEVLLSRVPGAAAEGMEGFGAAQAAADAGLPALEIRAISNRVGPRDRDAWKIPQALQKLEAACSILTEVFT
ncbi:futalosine hydrolase [Paenibacillus lemnae]|uniref:Futalosine hydrolase n=1 Tax=Paenibacillus lemnae TaxID=1330551 RepID=A0A848M508_PAELE|nr:futalosine hydrolase [Paenibacillus lemnae]NMO95192.1 futalosine hydrolase [Paenibacillus lemnae]